VSANTFEFELRDGTHVLVRPIRPDDEDGLLRLHGRLSDRSIRMRFFTFVADPPRKYLSYLTHVDGTKRFALVVEKDDEIVAVGRYESIPDSPGEAEIALLVEDAYQRKGIGTMLLEKLAQKAKEAGIEKMRAVMLPENHEMAELLEHSGFEQKMKFDKGLLVSTFSI
jgi:RimJ/RimL family protein N-acetyltransferase